MCAPRRLPADFHALTCYEYRIECESSERVPGRALAEMGCASLGESLALDKERCNVATAIEYHLDDTKKPHHLDSERAA